MKLISLIAATLGLASFAVAADKNWTPPKEKMAVQTISENVMAHHPELISVTFHGVPPGMTKVYTMFGGSYVDRIGNADDPDDVLVIETGCTILDPRWHRTHDTVKKYTVQLPLRDASGENVGLLVFAYHRDDSKGDVDYLTAANTLRDEVAKQIPSYADLFKPAKP